jgi:hypothetical protein
MTNTDNSTTKHLAAGYLRCVASLRHNDDPDGVWTPDTDPDQAAYDTIKRAIRTGPAERAWELVLEVLGQTTDENLATEAAGSLEDLVRHQGNNLIDQLEAEAQSNERFRWALGTIWLAEGDLPASVLERVVRASGNKIKPLTGPKPSLRVIERIRNRAT